MDGPHRGDARLELAVSLLYATTLGVSAGLLFAVQPMVGRWILPVLGGVPAVWTTVMLFFQAMLLAGYLHAHLLARWRNQTFALACHSVLIAVAWAQLPLRMDVSPLAMLKGSDPTWPLLTQLGRSIGLPVLVLAATSPLLQAWFGRLRHRRAHDPYLLYAASNLGSLGTLVAYPAWIEGRASLSRQAAVLSALFGALAIALLACGVVARLLAADQTPSAGPSPSSSAVRPATFLVWLFLAMVPSSLMLGVTTHITTDLAPMPLLWVLPLGLYLLSCIIAFSPRLASLVKLSRRAWPFLAMAMTLAIGVGLVQLIWLPVHLVGLLVAATVCHGELARRRPPVDQLTAFYLSLALGGVTGGLVNALVAPLIFPGIAEYPIAIVAALLVLALPGPSGSVATEGRSTWVVPLVAGLATSILCRNPGDIASTLPGVLLTMLASGLTLLVAVRHRRMPRTLALTTGALLLASTLATGINGRVLLRERNFFGVLRVTEVEPGSFRRLFHGSTLHGQQSLDPARRDEPLTYFTRSGPVGQVFEVFRSRPRLPGQPVLIAVTGLGVGTLAAYAEAGDAWSFHEIDPAMARVALDPRYFTYLARSRASSTEVKLGDARRTLAEQPDRRFDLLILDAFSSDAVPVHLLTREALALYRRKLAPRGLIVANITNRYLDLAPVVGALARDAGWMCLVRVDADVSPAEREAGKQGSIWAVLAPSASELGALAADPLWRRPATSSEEPAWTDESSGLFRHLRRPGRGLAAPSGPGSAR